ncbi:MAG: DUF4357 domain-containing protein [Rikenellaceae bacterium]|nr:DUF4357 domain-containing protein [Rikenellaceae bacterium]
MYLTTQARAMKPRYERLGTNTAVDFCLGRSANGWTIWKDKDGNTLDSVYRKQLE